MIYVALVGLLFFALYMIPIVQIAHMLGDLRLPQEVAIVAAVFVLYLSVLL